MRRLIADEVGLGKTLPAGIILKTRLNQGKAARALVIAPKAATGQWQSELLMKFAINARIIDAQVQRYRDGRAEPAAAPPWNAPLAIAGPSGWCVIPNGSCKPAAITISSSLTRPTAPVSGM